MSRPTSISQEKIIAAAREVFLERGFQATTADVARRAGVAEGTLFYKFKTKFDLFKAAMTPAFEEPEWLRELVENVGQGDLQQNLVQACEKGIAFFRSILPLMFMAWSNQNAAGLPQFLSEPSSPPLRVLKRLSSVIEAEMRDGRMVRGDAEVVARMMLGAMIHYVFFEMVMAAQKELPLPLQTYARSVVSVLWHGVEPAPTTKTTKTKKGTRK